MGKAPVLGLIYAPSKTGKTTDCLYSFTRALWFAAPGALKPSESVCGYAIPDSNVIDAESIPYVEALIAKLKPGKVDAVVVDDLSLLAERTVRHFVALRYSGFDLWRAVRDAFLALRETARRKSLHVILNAHDQGPRMINNARMRGGPLLPGKAADDIPKACDFVLRAQPIPRLDKAVGWPVVYRCTPEDPDYVSGDRDNVTADRSPMNIGEILRLAGYNLPRLAALPWQERMVENASKLFASVLTDDAACKRLNAEIIDGCMKKFGATEQHGIWTARDAYDRAVLRVGLSGHRRHYYT